MAFPADYTLLAKLSTVPAQISSSVTGFHALITDASLDAAASNVFANTDNGGGDVRLSLDEAGLSQLPVDIPAGGWDTVGGTCQLWTKIDIDSAVAVDVYVWGKNAGDTQPGTATAFGRNTVWADFELVIHQGTLVDSTGNHTVSAVGSPPLTSMMWGGQGYNLDNVSRSLQIPHNASLNIEKDYSLDLWIDDFGLGALSGSTYLEKTTVGNDTGFRFFSSGDDSIRTRQPNLTSSNLTGTDSETGAKRIASNSLNGFRFNIVNDAGVANDSPSGTVTNNTEDIYIGKSLADNSLFFKGVLGDLWLSIPARSTNRAAEYNNQSAPDTFWTASAIAAGIDVNPNVVNSDSVANNPTLQFNVDTNVIGQTANTSSVVINPAITVSSNITVNGQTVNSESLSNNPSISITSGVFIAGQTVNTQSISNDPSLQLDLSVTGNTVNTDSISVNPSISFGLVIAGNSVNTDSVSNDPTLQFNIDITGQTTNTLSNSINPAIQIGEITYTLDSATNINALSLSVNINAPILSTNING
jgi:hypothetical protein